MHNELYDYSPIVARPVMEFPGGARLAFYIGLNIEHFHVDMAGFRSAGQIPDPLSHGWRDYGTRVGIWRIIELLDELGLRASGIINSEVCEQYPQIIEAGVARDWAWVAHGKTNSVMQSAMGPEEEAVFLAEMVATLDASLPVRPRGWLGPALSETYETPRLLSELGFTYLLDWCCDDQPFALNVPGLISVPYSLDVNDIAMFSGPAVSGQDFERIVMDQFEQLLADSASTARVMALPLHPFIIGQPYRFKYLARVLKAIAATDGVWLTTSQEIADDYLSTHGLEPASSTGNGS